MEFLTPLTVDQDVFDFEPQLRGATSISGAIARFHDVSSDEVAKNLRIRWWADVLRGNTVSPWAQMNSYLLDDSKKTLDGMDTSKLSATQLKYLAVCRLLGWHIWPMLDAHNDPDSLAKSRAATWKKKFSEELDLLLQNGIAYDWDGDGIAELYTESIVARRGSVRISRE